MAVPKAKKAVQRLLDVKNPQLPLVDVPTEWEAEWKGMPEFVQVQQKPYAELTVRFSSEEDLQAFAELIQQKLTRRTKSIWYPQLIRGIGTDHRYYDES